MPVRVGGIAVAALLVATIAANTGASPVQTNKQPARRRMPLAPRPPGRTKSSWGSAMQLALFLAIAGIVTSSYGFFGPLTSSQTEAIRSFMNEPLVVAGIQTTWQRFLNVSLTSPLGLLAAGIDATISVDLDYRFLPAPSSAPSFIFYLEEVGGSHVSLFLPECDGDVCNMPHLEAGGNADAKRLRGQVSFPVGGDYAWILRMDIASEFWYFAGDPTNSSSGFMTVASREAGLQVKALHSQEKFNFMILGLTLIATAGVTTEISRLTPGATSGSPGKTRNDEAPLSVSGAALSYWRSPRLLFLVVAALASVVVGLALLRELSIALDIRMLLITVVILLYTVLVLVVTAWDIASVAQDMASISRDMRLVADDTARRAGLVPKLIAAFVVQNRMLSSIQIPASAKTQIQLILGNDGSMSALNAMWELFFPPTLAVNVLRGDASVHPQPPYAFYGGHTGLLIPAAANPPLTIVGQMQGMRLIDIEVTPQVGPQSRVEIPVNGQCSNHPQIATKLTVEVI